MKKYIKKVTTVSMIVMLTVITLYLFNAIRDMIETANRDLNFVELEEEGMRERTSDYEKYNINDKILELDIFNNEEDKNKDNEPIIIDLPVERPVEK